MTEADPHRSALITAMEATLPDIVSSVVWQLRLVAAPDLPVEVYRCLEGEIG